MSEEYDYEPPTVEEREHLVPPEVSQPERRELAREWARQRKDEVAQRKLETDRTTALNLAVQWTSTAAGTTMIGEEDIGPLFGLADLMLQYIETGKKPTETEAKRAWKPYR